MKNMDIWEKVEKTDPDNTKKISFGRKFTAIDAYSQIKKATELWGPMGGSWGVKNENWLLIYNDTRALYTATLYHSDDQEIPIRADCEVVFSSGKRQGQYNEDWSKKVATDALTKGLSYLGFNADIFMGKFDDNKYVEELYAAKQKESHPLFKMVLDSGIDEKNIIERLKKLYPDNINPCTESVVQLDVSWKLYIEQIISNIKGEQNNVQCK